MQAPAEEAIQEEIARLISGCSWIPSYDGAEAVSEKDCSLSRSPLGEPHSLVEGNAACLARVFLARKEFPLLRASDQNFACTSRPG